jgi:hypothetical protein
MYEGRCCDWAQTGPRFRFGKALALGVSRITSLVVFTLSYWEHRLLRAGKVFMTSDGRCTPFRRVLSMDAKTMRMPRAFLVAGVKS